MVERADDRLVRLLGIVAYLDDAGPVPLTELADRFGVTPERIRQDIDALWVSGTPGYMPDDLIDFDAFSLEDGMVTLTQSRGLSRPLRLGTREAVAAVAALRAMASIPAVRSAPERTAVVASALRKLSEATGEAAAALDVRIGGASDATVLAVLTEAVTAGRRVRLRYVDAADTTSERDVDPVRLLTQDDATYLVGWCYRAADRRTFRLDRVLSARMLADPVTPRELDTDVDVLEQVVAGTGGQVQVATVRLASAARWIAEEVPVESVVDLDDGAFEVHLRVTNPAWLRRLLLANATDVLGIDPPQVAAEVAAAAVAALQAYDET